MHLRFSSVNWTNPNTVPDFYNELIRYGIKRVHDMGYQDEHRPVTPVTPRQYVDIETYLAFKGVEVEEVRM